MKFDACPWGFFVERHNHVHVLPLGFASRRIVYYYQQVQVACSGVPAAHGSGTVEVDADKVAA
jgi:hypothetical protein